jgi:hypothetical protein
MSNITYAILLGKIRDHSSAMDSWWQGMDDVGSEWLLVMTLACWGVSNYLFQVLGFLLTASFFVDRLSKLHSGGTFTQTEKLILLAINESELSGPERNKLICALDKVKEKRKSVNFFKKNWRFLICYVFWVLSFLYVVFVHY